MESPAVCPELFSRIRSWFPAGVIACALILLLANCGGGGSSGPVTANSPLSITPAFPSVLQTESLQLRAMVQTADGSMQDVTSSAVWWSSAHANVSVQSVGQEFPGLATGNLAGSAFITATYQGASASATINCLSDETPQSLSILPSVVTVAVGTIQQFRAAEVTGDETANEETGVSTWTVSDASKASIQTAGQGMPGVLTAISPGTVTVTATAPDGLANSATVVIPSALPNTYKIPLPEMTSSQNYLGYPGSLYEDNSNTPPSDHSAAGVAAGAQVQALDTNGQPSPSGNIVFLGIGMSNANYEFAQFASDVDFVGSGMNYPTVMALDGAHDNATPCYWSFAQGMPVNCGTKALGNQYDRVRDSVLAPLGLTEAQVQVLWIKEADEYPAATLGIPSLCDPSVSGCVSNIPITSTGSGCEVSSVAEACNFDHLMGEMIRAARIRYVNLKEIFISSRIYAGYASIQLNPEPYAYEYGFAVKWLIENQILQARTGQEDPVAGDLSYTDGSAAWMAWGPYIWSSSVEKQTFDGVSWEVYPTDQYLSDGTHPSTPAGTQQVAAQLMTFFSTSPYTTWFPAVPASH